MNKHDIEQVRRFNRLISKRIGALETSYLSRGRPLSEARIVFEIGAGSGVELQRLRNRLNLDSGRMSRLLRSLEKQDLIRTRQDNEDGRARKLKLTHKGILEYEAYDQLSDELATGMIWGLNSHDQASLLEAMKTTERLLRKAGLTVEIEPASSHDASWCLSSYYEELANRLETGFDPSLKNKFHPEEMSPPRGWFVMARISGEAVGCGALTWLDASVAEIKRVWVSQEARGCGVASAIMDSLEALASENGFDCVKLDTNAALLEAHALYRKRGYREIERYNDNPYADHFFEKPV